MQTGPEKEFLAYHRRSILVGTTVLYAAMFATGVYALLSDADRIRTVESRAAVVSLGVVAVVISVWEGGKWTVRLVRGASGIRIEDEILVVDLTDRLLPTLRIPLSEIRSVSATDRALIVGTAEQEFRISIQPFEDAGKGTAERISEGIRSRIPT